jgi:hypothetical protein
VSRVLQESLNFGAVTVSWGKKKKIVAKNFAATGWSWVTRRSSKKLVVV